MKLGDAIAAVAGVSVGAWAVSQVVRRLRLTQHADFYAGKVVVITGASRGIGRALALAFAERGARLVLASRTRSALEAVAAECEALSAQALVVPTDVTNDEQLSTLVDVTLTQYGRIDVLVNNAGIVQGGPLTDDDNLAGFRRQLEVNLLSAVRLSQLVVPVMVRQHEGYIVNLASILGRFAMPNTLAYSASKFAMIGFGEGLRRELSGTGVRVLNVVCGFVSTEMIAGEPERKVRRSPLSVVTPEEVARRTLNALVLGKPDVYTGWFEGFAAWLNVVNPRLFDWLFDLLSPPGMREAIAQTHTH